MEENVLDIEIQVKKPKKFNKLNKSKFQLKPELDNDDLNMEI